MLILALTGFEVEALCITYCPAFVFFLLPFEQRIASVDTVGARRLAYLTACGYAWKSGGGSQVAGVLIVSSLLRDLDLGTGVEDCLLNVRDRGTVVLFSWSNNNLAVLWDALVSLEAGLRVAFAPLTIVSCSSCVPRFFAAFFRLNKAHNPPLEVRSFGVSVSVETLMSLMGGSVRAVSLEVGGRTL